MTEKKNAPQPLDDEALNETTGGTFFGMRATAATRENPVVMKDQLEEFICLRCGKVCSLPVGTNQCACGGDLTKYTRISASFTVKL